MNPQIQKLYQTAQKEKRTIIGLMSGTSLDGLDIALCQFSGAGTNSSVSLKAFCTMPYSESFKKNIRKVFAKEIVALPHLCQLNALIGTQHGEMVKSALKKWAISPKEVDAIASHGQTIMHSPKRLHKREEMPNSTLQIGDADHLAKTSSILTLSDFRQKHLAAGGEGAPLALYGDYLLFQSQKENRALVNIGGIANYTFLPSDQDFDKAYATDTGPGNTIIDAFVQKHWNKAFDKDATIAKKGKLNQELLHSLLSHSYFSDNAPKTTGPELFNLNYLDEHSKYENGSKKDTLHTLCHFTAHSLTQEIKKNIAFEVLQNTSIYLSGGGVHNPLICNEIKRLLPQNRIQLIEKLGVSSDAKEAVLFAAIANETLAGKTGFPSHFINKNPFYMGKISFPA